MGCLWFGAIIAHEQGRRHHRRCYSHSAHRCDWTCFTRRPRVPNPASAPAASPAPSPATPVAARVHTENLIHTRSFSHFTSTQNICACQRSFEKTLAKSTCKWFVYLRNRNKLLSLVIRRFQNRELVLAREQTYKVLIHAPFALFLPPSCPSQLTDYFLCVQGTIGNILNVTTLFSSGKFQLKFFR